MTPEPAPISGPPEFVWVYGWRHTFPLFGDVLIREHTSPQ
ncbi:MAG: hypothetical protein OJF50_002275 [Nitrospira sp.]|nr:hypothetical protein [Nitrospira sp.]